MDARSVANWWKKTGRDDLTLVLWATWDPLGYPPLDEYQKYADRLFSLLELDEEPDRIADELEGIRTRDMGLEIDRETDLEVAHTLGFWHYWAVEHRFRNE